MALWRIVMLALACFGFAAARADVLNDTVNGPHPVLALPARLVLDGVTLSHRGPAGRPPGETLTIARGRHRLLRLRDQSFELNYQHTGDGPNLIVTGWSGGAHCCFTLHVLGLQPGVRHQAIAVDDNDQVGFLDQGDAAPLLQFGDFNFAYWHTSFAESPAPRVILRFDPVLRRYRADFGAMRQGPPDEAALQDLSAKTGPALWGAMLDLIYDGNAPMARQLLDRAWPLGHKGKQRFLACFTRQLHSGRLWRRFRLGLGLGAEAAFPPHRVSSRVCRADW